jgi:hypothetical protein
MKGRGDRGRWIERGRERETERLPPPEGGSQESKKRDKRVRRETRE